MQIKKVVEGFKRRFPFSTPYRFLYRNKSDLKKAVKQIRVFFLIEEEGTLKVWPFIFRRKDAKTPEEWRDFLNKEGVKIFRTAALPAYNEKHSASYTYREVLGWSEYAISTGQDSASARKNQSTKKGPANESASHRSR